MVSGIVGREFARAQLRKTNDLPTFLGLLELVGRLDLVLVRPFSLALAASGILLAFLEGYPMLGFLQGGPVNWLLVANLLVLSIIALIVLVFVPRGRVFDQILADAKSKGTITPALRSEDAEPVVVWAHRWENVATLAILVLMIAKPF
jgi:hypothetical protein